MAAEGASLVEAVLTADARRMAFIEILTRLWVVTQLEAHGTRALGSKRALDAAVSAARIVIRAALLIYEEAETFTWMTMERKSMHEDARYSGNMLSTTNKQEEY